MKIGVVLPLGEPVDRDQPLPYSYVRAMALQAEAVGFDSIWTPDHLLFRFPGEPAFGIWEGWTMLMGLAEATERVEIGSLVMCLPFRNPALLAKMAITADEVSGGRMILGIGAGWHQAEFDAFGVPWEHLAGQFEEGVRIISPLLREGRVDFRGKHFSAPNCEMRPRGPRAGGPPVLIASRGKRMMRLTAEYADQWNAAWFSRPALVRERHAELMRACQKIGREWSEIAVTVGVYVGYPEHLSESERGTYSQWASFHDPDKTLRGTPEEIAASLQAFADDGIDHVICNLAPNRMETLAELTEALVRLR